MRQPQGLQLRPQVLLPPGAWLGKMLLVGGMQLQHHLERRGWTMGQQGALLGGKTASQLREAAKGSTSITNIPSPCSQTTATTATQCRTLPLALPSAK